MTSTAVRRPSRPSDDGSGPGSRDSVLSIGCLWSVVSVGSIASVLAIGSIASLASVGSIASVGSVGSIASIGSVGSIGRRHAVGAFFGVPVAEHLALALGHRLRASPAGSVRSEGAGGSSAAAVG